ncbi:MAG: glycerophosphodiester phosphodiesterase [Alphaproteobacteria bacterium]
MFLRFTTLCIAASVLCTSAMAFDLQGHRGARGLMPENTLPAFAEALSIGVSTLELDVGITADGHIVVSHDPALNPNLTRTADGAWVEPDILIKDLTLEALQAYHVGQIKPGSRAASRFPDQQAFSGIQIPTLGQVFDLVKRSGNEMVRLNIETKINPEKPENSVVPEASVDALLALITEYSFEGRVTIQSFDWRTLQLVQAKTPAIETVYLTAQQDWLDNVRSDGGKASPWSAGFILSQYDGNVPAMVKAAGGAVWSPFFGDVTNERIQQAQALGLKVIPWTVNDSDAMEKLMDAGVDGIISDYPDRLRAVMQDRNMDLPLATPVQP